MTHRNRTAGTPAVLFDLVQLRCFVAVAEELHFARAAARLNMTQPPLSRHIQVLERVLGVPLLLRTSRSVRLTEPGRSFLPEAIRILRLAESATETARQVASGRSGTVKLAFTASAGYDLLPRLLAACRTRLPDLHVELREMVSREAAGALLAGTCDLALLRPPLPRPRLQSLELAAEPMVLALPFDHPLTRSGSVTLATVADEPLVGYHPDEARFFCELADRLFAGAGVAPRIVQRLAQIHSILSLVRSGLGLALVPASAARIGFAGLAFRRVPEAETEPSRLHLAWRRDGQHPGIREVVDLAGALAPTRIDADPVSIHSAAGLDVGGREAQEGSTRTTRA